MCNFHKRLAVSAVILLFSLNQVCGQYFDIGQDPASIEWKQINTEHFELIYPDDFENKAQHIANIFEVLFKKGDYSLNHTPQKISIVLHTRGAISNGLVGWAPKRMELYSTPPQNNYPQTWLKQLAIHEFRHVVQMDKFDQGFTRFLSFLFGEQTTAAVVGLYIPPWFMEGDAVCNETALSNSGRGRLPFFEQELRAQLLEKGIYSYDKAVLGSFKSYVPDRYNLGYHMVALGRKNYGTKLWEKTLNNVGRNPLGVTPFSSEIKRTVNKNRPDVLKKIQNRIKNTESEIKTKHYKSFSTNIDSIFRTNSKKDAKITLYLDNMSELRWEWEVQDNKNNKSEYNKISKKNKIYTNYRFPHYDENGDILAQKEGLADAAHFVHLKHNGDEKEVFMLGFDFNTSFDYYNNTLLWAEQKSNLRWENAEKAVLVTYNLKTKIRKKFKFNNNLFAPVFSPDGQKILAVETTQTGQNNLVILDTKSGKLLKRIKAKNDDFFMTPQWTFDGENIITIIQNEKGKRIAQLNLNNQKSIDLLAAGFSEIAQLRPTKKYLFFTAAYSGIDNIYALNLDHRKIYQVTSSRFGARDAQTSSDRKTLAYADYNSDGYQVVETKVMPEQWKEWNNDIVPFNLAEAIAKQEQGVLKIDSIKQFTSSKYSKLKHILNFHSWAPVFIDGLSMETDIGVSAATQNKLSTLFGTFGYRKQQGFDNGQYYANISYRGWFPIFDSKLTYGDRNSTFFTLAERTGSMQIDTLQVKNSWSQWEWENSVSLPLNISKGKYSRKITPKFTYNQLHFTNINTTPLRLMNRSFGSTLGTYQFDNSNISRQILEYSLFAYNILKSAPRDIQPRFAQTLHLKYRHSPFGDIDLGKIWAVETFIYLPGLAKHHGIKLYGGYQQRSPFNSLFANTIMSPRGTNELFGKENAAFGIDYRFPFAYPDWNLGALAYLKRIKTGFFVDHGFSKGYFNTDIGNIKIPFQYTNNSFGVELSADMHLFRFPAPINFGVRVGYEDDTNSSFAEFLFSIDLTSY